MRPKKKKITTVRYEDDTQGETPASSLPVFQSDPQQEETIQNVVENFAPGQVLVKVYRITPTGKSFCFTAGPDINEEMIQARGYYGKFTLQVIANGEFRTSISVEVDPPPAAKENGNVGGSDITRIVLDRLASLDQRLSSPVEREPINNLADAMLKMHQMTAQRPQSEMTLDQILKCIEIGKSLNGGGEKDWTSELMGIAKESLPMLAAAMQTKQQPNGGMAHQQPVAQLAETVVTDEQMKMKLRQGIAFLKQMAIQPEADPGLWVDLIVARRNEPDFAYLIHKAIAEEFSEFIQVDQDINRPEYVKFFRSIYDGLRSVFNPAHQVDGDSGGSSGNKAHVGSNGATGKGRGK